MSYEANMPTYPHPMLSDADFHCRMQGVNHEHYQQEETFRIYDTPLQVLLYQIFRRNNRDS